MQRRDVLSSALALLPPPHCRQPAPRSSAAVSPGSRAPSACPPAPPRQGGLAFFTQHEFDTAAAMADRLIPADDLSIGGKEAGCATFIDRQLASDYGKGATLYRLGRFVKGTFGKALIRR